VHWPSTLKKTRPAGTFVRLRRPRAGAAAAAGAAAMAGAVVAGGLTAGAAAPQVLHRRGWAERWISLLSVISDGAGH